MRFPSVPNWIYQLLRVCYFTKQVLGRCFVSTKQPYSFKYNHRLTTSTDLMRLTPVSLYNLPFYLALIFPAQLRSVGQVKTLSIVTPQIGRERGLFVLGSAFALFLLPLHSQLLNIRLRTSIFDNPLHICTGQSTMLCHSIYDKRNRLQQSFF